MGKLLSLFERKEEVCKDRQKLISPFYFGGFIREQFRMHPYGKRWIFISDSTMIMMF